MRRLKIRRRKTIRIPYLFLAVICGIVTSCQFGEESLSTQISTEDPLENGLHSSPEPTIFPTRIPSTRVSSLPTLNSPSTPEPITENCQSGLGTIHQYSFQSTRDQNMLGGRIYLPPCYAKNDSRFPVIYLMHGAEATAAQWDNLGVNETADRLIDEGQIPEIILVMPEETSWRHPSENPFGEQVVKDIVPWVDSHYRTLDSRKYRAIGGISRGGNWAVRLGLLHWSSFGYIGAHSSPLFIGDLQRIGDWLDSIPESYVPSIYLDIGQDDKHLNDARAMERVFLDYGVPYEWHLNPGLHTEEYWQNHLEDYLIWYTQKWIEN